MELTPKSNVTVVIPKEATSRELFAAQELEKYLKLIFNGIIVNITPDNEDASAKSILR